MVPPIWLGFLLVTLLVVVVGGLATLYARAVRETVEEYGKVIDDD